MTSKEFLKGWVLLIAQPWGKRYEGDSEVAQAQREFYFNTVKSIDGPLWFQACCTLAAKTEWPSIGAVKSIVTTSGHPGPEEAWAIVAQKVASDAPTIFVTDPMREAYGAALLLGDDMVAARMAFKETYALAVTRADAAGHRAEWSMIPGTHRDMKTTAIQEGVKKGIVRLDWALRQLPSEAHNELLQLAGTARTPQLIGSEEPRHAIKLLEEVTRALPTMPRAD